MYIFFNIFIYTEPSENGSGKRNNKRRAALISKVMFEMTVDELNEFFKRVNTGKRVRTSLTTKVIRAKELIRAHIDTLNLSIVKQLMKIKLLLDAKNNDAKGLMVKHKDKLINVNYWCMYCPICKHNCHINCHAWWRSCCQVISWSFECTQCEEGCGKNVHKVEKKKWKYDFATIAMNEDNISSQLQDIELKLYGKMGIIFIYVAELRKIAFNPMKYSPKQKIDSLIANEELQGTPHRALIKYLTALKDDSIINAIEKYGNNVIQNNNGFAELTQKKLKKYFKEIRNTVKTVKNKQSK